MGKDDANVKALDIVSVLESSWRYLVCFWQAVVAFWKLVADLMTGVFFLDPVVSLLFLLCCFAIVNWALDIWVPIPDDM